MMAGRLAVACLATLVGLCSQTEADAASRKAVRTAPAPAPASLPEYGTVGNYEPRNASFYLAQRNSIKAALAVNETFFSKVNASTASAVKQDKNGTFAIKFAAQPGESRIEDANTDGYDYGEVLGMSWLFYEAKRSGKLPSTNRVAWRGGSALDDKAPDGSDVSGGWYDAGDHLKLNFPMAWSASALAWGFIEFQNGYSSAAQTQYALDGLKWAADYFVKCHHSDIAYTVQVGDPGPDHAYWGRPEDMTMPRPSWDVDQSNPGSDALGQTAAALAAISIIYESVDAEYALLLEAHARDLYAVGTTFLGKYSDSIKAAYVYPSSNFYDDLTWAACWMYRKTGEQQFLNDALAYWKLNKDVEGGGGYLAWNWDSSIWGADVLLATLAGSAGVSYAAEVERFLESWIEGQNGIAYTPGGLAWASEWASNRFVGNAAMIAAVYASHIQGSNATKANRYSCWARSQAKYILGDCGRSYVVGYGNNPPTHIHHRGASCQPEAQPWGSNNPVCNYNDFNLNTSNPSILYGALAGGPGNDDSYVDIRSDYEKNEVAVDYNSGWTGLLAYLEGSPDSWDNCIARGDVLHIPTAVTNNAQNV